MPLLLICASLALAAKPPPVDVRLVGVKDIDVRRDGVYATVKLEATRRAGVPVKLREVEASLMLNQVEIATVETRARVRLRRDQPAVIELPARIEVGTALLGGLGALGQGSLDLRVKGAVEVGLACILRRRVPIQLRLQG